MLQRAKSFILRSKREEDRQKYADLDLSETTHLRRNVSIDNTVLQQQHNQHRTHEYGGNQRRAALRRQVSRSNEHLHDQVVEQLRRINFGDSYSKKHALKLREGTEEPQEFERRHPAYISETNYRRKSFGAEDKTKNAPKNSKNENHIRHRKSGDVMSNFDRKNPVYCSETRVQVQETTKGVQKIGRCDNNTHGAGDVVLDNFDRRNPTYWSERSVQILRQQCSEQNDFASTRVIGGDVDFLLNRKSVDLSYNFDRRNPAYVSDRSAHKAKPDIVEKTRLKSLFQKVKMNRNHHNKDSSETSSVSSSSASSSAASTLLGRDHPAYFSEKDFTQNQKSASANESGFSSASTTSSAASCSIDSNHPAYFSEKNTRKEVTAVTNDEQSRKRRHNLTKSNFNRNKPADSSERTLVEESRKKVFDRLKREGDKEGYR